MKYNILFVTIVLFSGTLLSCDKTSTPQTNQQAVNAPAFTLTARPVDDKIDITVVSIERMGKFYVVAPPDGLAAKPKSPGDEAMAQTAGDGKEFALIRVTFKAKPNYVKKEETYDKLEATDESGTIYKSVFGTIINHDADSETITPIPFEIPKGIRLKTLQIGDRSFDISNF